MIALLSCATASRAGSAADNQGVTSAGFRSLAWGSSPAAAKAAYPDFAFVRFALPDESEPPYGIYARSREERELFGVSFARLSYWYRDERLLKVTAEAGEIVGPRTIQSAAEAGFDKLVTELTKRFGAPVSQLVSGALKSRRTATWNSRGTQIVVTLAPGEGDIQLLSLEMGR
jgi:hypothetical protein